MKLGFRIRMETNKAQAQYCRRAAGVSRLAWNWGKAEWDRQWACAKAEVDEVKRRSMWPSAAGLRADWNKVRRTEFAFTLDVTKCAGAQALINLGSTYDRARKELVEAKLSGRKARKEFGFPRFKAKNKTIPSFRLWNDQFKITNHYSVLSKPYAFVTLPHIEDPVRLAEPVPMIGGILAATVSYRRGKWHIAFQFDTDWNNGEVSDRATTQLQGRARKASVAEMVASGMTEKDAKAKAKESVTLEAARPERFMPLHPKPGTIGGGDLGLHDAVVGSVLDLATRQESRFSEPNPRRLTRTEKEAKTRLRRQRKLSRSIHKARTKIAADAKAEKGDKTPVTWADLKVVKLRLSKRQRRQSESLSKDLWRDADRRGDFLHKTSLKIALAAEIVVLEDLHVKGMLANHCLAKSLSDSALGRLATMAEYKAERAGGMVLWAPRFFPSTKMCSSCGHIHPDLTLNDRQWTCPSCQVLHDRDGNAAKNLRALGELAAADPQATLPGWARPWGKWIEDSKVRVGEWQLEKVKSLALLKELEVSSFVGAACPEFTRGEIVERGRRNSSSEAVDELRTTIPFNGDVHVCALVE